LINNKNCRGVLQYAPTHLIIKFENEIY